MNKYKYKIKLNIIGNNVNNLYLEPKNIDKMKKLFNLKYDPYILILETLPDVEVYTTSLYNSLFINKVLREPINIRSYKYDIEDIKMLHNNQNIFIDYFKEDNGVRCWLYGDLDKNTVLDIYMSNFISSKFLNTSILDIESFIKEKDEARQMISIINNSDNKLSMFNYSKFINYIICNCSIDYKNRYILSEGKKVSMMTFITFLNMCMPLDSRNLKALFKYTIDNNLEDENIIFRYLKTINKSNILNNTDLIRPIDINDDKRIKYILKRMGI